MLRFPYQAETLAGPAPPSLAPGATVRWRPYVPIRIIGAARTRQFGRALIDTGADDTIFPRDVAALVGASFRPVPGGRRPGIRWRGNWHPVDYADVELELSDASQTLRWNAIIGFSPAPLPTPFLGQCGFLEFVDATFRRGSNIIEIEPNPATYGGSGSCP